MLIVDIVLLNNLTSIPNFLLENGLYNGNLLAYKMWCIIWNVIVTLDVQFILSIQNLTIIDNNSGLQNAQGVRR